MTATRKFQPSSIKNKIKREDEARKQKRAKRQDKLQRRLALAKAEANDPAAKRERLAKNVPRTLDNTREFDPSYLTADPALPTAGPSTQPQLVSGTSAPEIAADIEADPFASYFSGVNDPSIPPKVLITTSPSATRATYRLCEELVGLIPGSELIKRKKGKDFVIGKISGWCAGRGYTGLIVVNENTKKPNAVTFVHLPNGPTAYFKLTSIQYSEQISGHARPTAHFPELVLNGFATRLGHTVGRFFQSLFPALPEFQGRQVVTLHNQRDFLFLRRHRYAFRSEEKVALQEIGPRFTLKLRWLKKGIPASQNLGAPAKPLEFDLGGDEPEEAPATLDGEAPMADATDGDAFETSGDAGVVAPPKANEFEWQWKPELETTRRTFFL